MQKAAAVALFLCAGGVRAEEPAAAAAELERLLGQFVEVFAAAEKHAAEPVNSYRAVYGGAIPGMLKRLDPHSIFFDPDQFEQLRQLQTATQKGFGSVVSILPGRVFVLQTLAGTPSANAGMQPGDEILAINNIALDRLSVEQLVGLLSESRRREVNLFIRRPGAARLIEITMKPESMASESVDLALLLEPGIGYVRVKSFEGDTGRRVREAIEKLGGAKLQALALDLRDNHGGVMGAALETAALFLPSDQVIVSVRGRGRRTEEIKVPGTSKPYAFRLAVLVGPETASGAEIVAGAVQDLHRGVVVGLPTFGKGLVQQVYDLSDNTGLALTTAYYYTPSGRSIQRPIAGGQLDPSESRGGGVQPEHIQFPEPMNRLRMVLEGSGAFPTFATLFLRKSLPVEASFEVSDSMLDDFQSWLSERGIQPSVGEWSTDREWTRGRLKQEIFNQAFGVARGDEVELRRDAVVRAAVALLKRPGESTVRRRAVAAPGLNDSSAPEQP